MLLSTNNRKIFEFSLSTISLKYSVLQWCKSIYKIYNNPAPISKLAKSASSGNTDATALHSHVHKYHIQTRYIAV